MAEQVSALLQRSLALVAREAPASYALIIEQLGRMAVVIDVDGEQFSLRGGDSVEVRDGACDGVGPRITTTRAVILDVLDARVSLTEAVESGAVAVVGALDDVIRAHDTLLAYVHAAVRAPSQPGLLAELRGTS